MRLTIRVRPGSARPGVGGHLDAALAAIAAAFRVRPGSVRLVAGARSRTKIIEVDGAQPAVLERLLDGGEHRDSGEE